MPTPANTEDANEPRIPGFINTLHRIGAGAAADGHPWLEPQLRLGRRIALADTDCALAGLRIVQELVLASGRVRQSGGTGWSMPPFGQRRWLRADWPGKQQHGIDFMDECGLPGQERGASRSAPVLRRIGNALALVIGGCTAWR